MYLVIYLLRKYSKSHFSQLSFYDSLGYCQTLGYKSMLYNACFHIAHVSLLFGNEANTFGQILMACSNFRLQKNMKCIIFVNRIVTARSLSYILQKLKLLRQWRSDYLVGVHAGLKSMSRKTMNIIVDKFRSGEVLLLDFSLL